MSTATYYWAGGRKVHLSPSSEVVIDLDSAVARGAPPGGLDGKGRHLSKSLLILPKTDAEEILGQATATAPGVHPVYRTDDGTLLAVLPQVRVEARDPRALSELGRSIADARVTERTDERLVLEPDSGRGEDALALANLISEIGRAEVSQARFIRIVSRPETA